MGQLHLLLERRFWPLFWTQFLGAFNDNLFKNTTALLVAFGTLRIAGIQSETIVVGSTGIFILPFFLFSATAGQITDRFSKSRLILGVKLWEMGVMLLAGIGFFVGSLPLLLVVVFLMGLQSTFFGPAKYAVLPELLDPRSLVGGNALVEMGTFLAILLGTIAAGEVAKAGGLWVRWFGLLVVGIAGAGTLTSLFLPRTPPGDPNLRIQLDPIRPTGRILAVTRRPRVVFLAVLGISWFWLLGAAFISLLPIFVRDVLGGDERVFTLFLALFCVGIAVGSLLCDRLSGHTLELGLVPLGSIGISLLVADFAWGAGHFVAVAGGGAGPLAYLAQPGGVRIAADLFGVAVFSGFYTVPLYTLVQARSATAERSRVIAGLNILNSGFMVASSVLIMVLRAAGVSIPAVFGLLAVLNAAVAIYIYTVLPEFLLRFAAWVAARLIYRLRLRGIEHVPTEGPAVLVANHVSFADWLLLAAAVPRPVRFVIDHRVAGLPVLRFLFRDAKVIPIAPRQENETLLERALDRVAEELAAGELVCLFPEGGITSDGALQPFHHGIERIVERTPVPVVPVAITGMWGSFFSRKDAPAMTRPFRRVWSRVGVRIGVPVPPEQVTADGLAERVAELGGWPSPPRPTAT